MGEAFSTLLQRVVPPEAWGKNQCGPTLRMLFGAYQNPDYWSCYRRFRAIDDGDGYVSYEELLQVISMQEYNLLFLWDNFSQQNELVPAMELMTVLCVFSSATLFEKGKFLMSLFDESHTGLNTGMEIARIMFTVLSVLAKCTGERIKQREVTAQLKGILPDLLPTYAEELRGRYSGKPDQAFQNARCIGQIELQQLLPAIQSTYEALPVSGPAPDGACLPPPQDWAETVGERRPPIKTQPPAPDETQGAVKLSKQEIAHLEWMSGLLDDDGGSEGKENLSRNAQRAPEHTTAELSAGGQTIKKQGEPAQRWMVIYGSDFSVVARNLTSFRMLFIKSVSHALALPQGCIEVESISRGPGRAVVVAFLVHPAGRNGDTRDGADLAALLEQQLILTHSALRKGAFKEYCASAELFESAPDPQHWPPQPMEATFRGSPSATQRTTATHLAGALFEEPEAGPDATDMLSDMLAEAKGELEAMRRERDELSKQLKAKSTSQTDGSSATAGELSAVQAELAEVRAELERVSDDYVEMKERAFAAEAELESANQRADKAEKECSSLTQYIKYLEEGEPAGQGTEGTSQGGTPQGGRRRGGQN